MDYKKCKEKYDIYTKSLESKKSQLKDKEKELELIRSNYDKVYSIYVSAKEELENVQNKLSIYTKKKFSKSLTKLFATIVLLSIVITIVIGCTSGYEFFPALLGGPSFLLAGGMLLGGYSFIQETNPEFIQRFWKKDKTFSELKELVKEKERELSIAEDSRKKANDNFVKCRKNIKILRELIAYIENDIKELMLSMASSIFSEEEYEQDNTQEKPYTRIKRPENKN